MTASLLNGTPLANRIKRDLKDTIAQFVQSGKRSPSLAVILVGDDSASEIYVANKHRACKEVGITSYAHHLSSHISEEELIDLIKELNGSPEIDGILVQLPLPSHIKTENILTTINPYKDVDGFHPYNMGRLAQYFPLFRPCTPMGIMELLAAYNINVQSKHAVIIGASTIVGRPMALELLQADATVTICHRFTTHLETYVKLAEILIVAAGVMDIINPKWLKQDQILIDVGIHRLNDGTLRGDVNFIEALSRVAWLTPVPGGVGPMTIISLLQNTLIAAQLRDSL